MACHHRGHAPPTVVVASSATTRSSADGVAREPRGRHLARQRGPESGGRRTDITGLHPPHRLRAVNRRREILVRRCQDRIRLARHAAAVCRDQAVSPTPPLVASA